MYILIFALLSAVMVRAQNPPALLQGALKRMPGVTILDPKIDFAGFANAEDPVAAGYWPPWVSGDFDHDGKPDVVAVLTRRESSGIQFAVLAVHSRNPERMIWISKMAPPIYYGVTFLQENFSDRPPNIWKDRILPLGCVSCDANSWVRWTGRSYEWGLFSSSDELVAGEQDIFSVPDENARVVGKSGKCTRMRAIDFRGSEPQTRWYLIETISGKRMKGWVPASVLHEGSECYWLLESQ